MDESTVIIIVCVCAGIFLITTSIVAYCLFQRCKKSKASPGTSSPRQLSPSLSDGNSGRQIVITPEQYTSDSHAYTYDNDDDNGSTLVIRWPLQQYRPAKIDDSVVDDGEIAIPQGLVIPNAAKIDDYVVDNGEIAIAQELVIPNAAKIDDYVVDDGEIASAQGLVIPNSDTSQSQLEYIEETQTKTVEIPSIQKETIERPRVDEPRQIVITPEQYTSYSHACAYNYDNVSTSVIRWPVQQYRPNAARIDDYDLERARALARGEIIPNGDRRPQMQIEDGEYAIAQVQIEDSSHSQLEYIQETQKKIDDYVFDDGDIAIAQSDSSQSQLEYIQETQKKMEEFRSIQQQIIERPRVDEPFSLLICVDATPKCIGGYCVDFNKRICYCYTFKADMLPWDLKDKSRIGNPAEFEMKNLLFALLLWEDKIKTYGQVQIHTDNFAIKPHVQDKYGMRASDFLQHLEQCEGIQINKDIHINSKRNPEDFAKYITPADDLSRWNIAECQRFLRKVHGIKKFAKSHAIHEQNYNRRTGVTSGRSYTPTHNYTEFINKVKSEIRYWNHNPCLNCSFMVKDTTSLRSIVLNN